MSVEPFEFIDFSKFEFQPINVSRHRVDPLAIDIKLEPVDIKQEPEDSLYVEADKDASCSTHHVNNPFVDQGNVGVVRVAEALSHSAIVKQEHLDAGVSADDENNMVENTLVDNWLFNSTRRQILSDNYRGIVNCTTINGTSPCEYIEKSIANFETTVGENFTQLKTFTSEDPNKKSNQIKRYLLSCYHCGYTSNQKCHMRYHINAKHTGVKPYSCQKCNSKFVQKGCLKRHISSVHLKEKPFKCEKCSITCGRKEDLKRHYASMHDNLKPHSCSECPYSTVRKYHLNNHVRTVHRKERPFRCDQCSYAASKKTHLIDHVFLKHKGVKRFSCRECPFKTNQNSNLKQHFDAVHKKLKPFICHHCNHRFSHKNSLRGHISTFHLHKIKLICHHCKFSTRNKAVLRKHNRKHLR